MTVSVVGESEMEKSAVPAMTWTSTFDEWLIEPLEPTMLRVYVPAGVVGLVVTVRDTEAVPPEPNVTLLPMEAEAPDGCVPIQPTDTVMVPLKPLIDEKLTSFVVDEP